MFGDKHYRQERYYKDDYDAVDVYNVLHQSTPEFIHVVGDSILDDSVAEPLDTIESELEEGGSHHKDQGSPAWRSLVEGECLDQDQKETCDY